MSRDRSAARVFWPFEMTYFSIFDGSSVRSMTAMRKSPNPSRMSVPGRERPDCRWSQFEAEQAQRISSVLSHDAHLRIYETKSHYSQTFSLGQSASGVTFMSWHT